MGAADHSMRNSHEHSQMDARDRIQHLRVHFAVAGNNRESCNAVARDPSADQLLPTNTREMRDRGHECAARCPDAMRNSELLLETFDLAIFVRPCAVANGIAHASVGSPGHAPSAETRDRTGNLQIFGLTLSQLSYRGG